MRSQVARLTVECPACGEQLIIHVRFPLPEHQGIKQAEVIRFRCSPACLVSEAQIREALQL